MSLTKEPSGSSVDPAGQVEEGKLARGTRRNLAFWMVFVAGMSCDFLTAMDMTAISTALPTIAERLDGVDFIWAGSAYSLTSTAIIPMCGGLVSVFGRKPILLGSIVLFALGSALCGGAQNMNMLISGRAIQGFGGGGCMAATDVIYADLIPLPERGRFLGITASVWALAAAIGPTIAGAVTSSGSWRWLFFLNVPVCAISIVMVVTFLRVKALPHESFTSKMVKMDWIGNIVIIASTVSITWALMRGGLYLSWGSAEVLVPLCVGIAGIASFFVIEILWVSEPTIPWTVVANRTSFSGYIATFLHGIVAMALLYYLPVYYQAVQLASPIGSSVDDLGMSFTVAPAAILCGASIQVLRRYRLQNYIGWIFMIVGLWMLTLLDTESSRAKYIGFPTILTVGTGMIWISTSFPILSPLPYSNNARALCFFTYVRFFAQGWGVAIGGAILQSSLRKTLPASFDAQFPLRVPLAYAAIPKIRALDPELQSLVREAFASSLQLLWKVMIGLAGAGLMSILLMEELPMKTDLDEQWGLQEGTVANLDEESRVTVTVD
ncbi:iron permease [Artomyces pyxidatus]|uniref:Iron permease n=1 Tax=Artomyces pyxidatus TaxID=48021 RepID=A0ACB8SSQ0_9AGAM|nr:iron permease [Artomyces pyxidatus]